MGLAGTLVLAACSGMHPATSTTPTVVPVSTAANPADADAGAQTVTDSLSDSAEPGTTTVLADAGSALNPSAPKDYVVKRGDTLWGIANLYLKSPWNWPEIWYVNPDISNPHRIYPGDTIHLALRSDGSTALQVVRGGAGPGVARLQPLLRSQPLESAIATIPYGEIQAFISRPGVLSKDEALKAPYVFALPDDHQIAGSGNELYVKKLAGEAGARYSVMHVDEPLTDPESGAKLGYVVIYAGTAQLTQPGAVSKVMLTDSARETLAGDVLVGEDQAPTGDLAPHPPAKAVSGQVVAVVDNVLLGGQYDVLALNRGAKDGLDRGTVLTVDQATTTASDPCPHLNGLSTCIRHRTQQMPTETAGTLLVFKTYDHMAYALVLSDVVPIHLNDRIRNP